MSSASPRPAEPYVRAVHHAWTAAAARREPQFAPLALALQALARDARGRGVGVEHVLRVLTEVVRPSRGGDRALDFDAVREWAGRVVIRAYYRDD